MGTIMEDAAIQVFIGDVWTGAAPVFTGAGSGFDFMATARSIDIEDDIEKTNVQGAGSGTKSHRYHSEGATLRLTGVVPASGFSLAGASRAPLTKTNVKVTTKPKSTLVTGATWIGVVTKWRWSTSQGEAQIEEIELDLTPDVSG